MQGTELLMVVVVAASGQEPCGLHITMPMGW
jgi:hypothetical protein